MDRKRKSVFVANIDDGTGPPSAKIHRHESSLYKPSTDTNSSNKSTLELLTQLVNEIIESSPKASNPFDAHVVSAAKEFNHALSQVLPYKSGLENPITLSLERVRDCNGGILPRLPSIPDRQLEKAVFTHPGVSSDPRTNYDRLEVLGDAYIELIATRLICNKFQDIPSGRISQIRERLVKNETLSEYATQYGLDTRASVPQDHLNQPKRWIKTRGDIFEAYVAAVILSQANGYSIAEDWLSQLWSPKLERIQPSESSLNAKETLAKKIMGKGVKLRYIDEQPPLQHERGEQVFFIGVYLTGWGWDNKHLGSGQGPNKTIAGHRAAQQALENSGLINEIVKVKRKT